MEPTATGQTDLHSQTGTGPLPWKRLSARSGVLAAALGVVATIGVFNWTNIAPPLCRLEPLRPLVGQIEPCSSTWRSISQEEAEVFLDRWLSRASGAEPRNAWADLSPSYQETFTEERFVDDWRRVLWAERTQLRQIGDEFNGFELSYRVYANDDNSEDHVDSPKGKIIERRETFLLSGSGQIAVKQISGRVRIAQARVAYPQIFFRVDTMTHLFPKYDSAPQVLEVNRGSSLRALCVLRSAPAAGVLAEDWYRTRLGWAAGSDLASAPSGAIEECEPHHATKK